MAEQFLVSARKYRPQTFDTVVGQQHITTTLQNAIRNQQLAHAYLFCGPRGVGKTTCARILAKTLNCENPTAETEACGHCSTCTSFANNTSFNVFELDAASNNSVEDIRELANQVRFAPQHGKYKIYIIDEVHMLSAAAFNAFLKTLEEPPPYAIFILATTEKHKILPTILSRCQIFDFKRITTTDVVHHLASIAQKESVHAEEEALHIIALKSEGCMRDALSMMDRIVSFTNGQVTYANATEHLNLLDAEFYFSLGDNLLAKDVAHTMLQLDEILDKGFEGNVVLEGLAEYYRDLLLCKDQRMAKLLDVPAAHKPIYFTKAQYTPPSFILNALSCINEALIEYRNTNNKRLHTEMCLLKLCFLNDVIAVASAGEKKNSELEVEEHKPTTTELQPQENIPENSSTPTAAYQPETPKLAPQLKEDEGTEAITTDASQPLDIPIKEQGLATKGLPFAAQAGSQSRLNNNLLDLLFQESDKEQQEESIPLSQDTALKVFGEYLDEVKRASNKMTYSTYLQEVTIEAVPPDCIRLKCKDELAETFIRGHRDSFLDFFEDKMKRRILIEIEITPNEQDDTNKQMVLTKKEMFDALLQSSAALRTLNEKYFLSID